MNEARRRLLEGSQPLYLGLVGMVLAISLELLVARVGDVVGGGVSGFEAVLLGLEVLCLFQALVYLWVAWGMGTALLRVVPNYLDAVAPLTIGVFSFVAVSWIDTRQPLALLWLTGAAFSSVVFPTARLFARAKAEKSNAGALEGLSSHRMLWWNGAIGATCLALAFAGTISGATTAAASVGFAAANALIAGATLEWLAQARRAAGA